MDTEKFKVLTLNCWGVFPPLFCEKRKERLAAIGDRLFQGEYDILIFQELYITTDFERMKRRLNRVYPYINYFHSMMFGSGCAIFTKFRITQSFFMPYTLNGYSYKIQHGDYYAGKGIGFVTVETRKKFIINIYLTHTHARYDAMERDFYAIHRLNQSIEMSQFIMMTSQACDAVILGGDLNMDTNMLSLNLITTSCNLSDAYLTQENPPENPEQSGATSCRPDNPFCCKDWLLLHQYGERIDFIFYRPNKGFKVVCHSSKLALTEIPEMPNLHYSDHEGLDASFSIIRDPSARARVTDSKSLSNICSRAIIQLTDALVRGNRIAPIVLRVCLLGMMSLALVVNLPSLFVWLVTGYSLPAVINNAMMLSLAVYIFAQFWYTFPVRIAENKSLRNSIQTLNWIALYHSGDSNYNEGPINPLLNTNSSNSGVIDF